MRGRSAVRLAGGAVRTGGGTHGCSACDIGAFEYDSNQTPNVVTMHDLTATANTSPGVIGAVGAAFASLAGLWVGRRVKDLSGGHTTGPEKQAF